MKRLLLCVLLILAGCGTSDSTDDEKVCQALTCSTDGGFESDAGTDDAGANDAGLTTDAGADDGASPDVGSDLEALPTLQATESHEADVLYGWVTAGQPSQDRVREVVATGATIISLRLPAEDPFDEPGLIDSLGGEFIRYPTTGADYDSVDFRQAMYDLYDQQLDANKIVYLHCASSNRVGASWALYQAERKGVAPEQAIEMGRTAGLTSLESRVRTVLGRILWVNSTLLNASCFWCSR